MDAKAQVDKDIRDFEEFNNIDINETIEDAYTKYGELIDKDVIHLAFVRVLITIANGQQSYNTLGLSDSSWDSVNSLLKANGFEPLALSRTGTKYSIEAGMIFLSALAKEKGYGPDDLDELFCEYKTNPNFTTFTRTREQALASFNYRYYPWLSKDPGSREWTGGFN